MVDFMPFSSVSFGTFAIKKYICYNKSIIKTQKRMVKKMNLFYIMYALVFVVIALAGYSVVQIKLFGLNVKDFWSFIEANQILDKLYVFSKKYEKLSTQEQIIYLAEAEKIFKAFDKVPPALWEEEYEKYAEVLEKYKDIKVQRWNSN